MTLYLVTGGAGFIGSHLVEALVARGDRVRVLDNLASGRRENLATVADRIEFVAGSVADPDVTVAAVRGVDVIFHQAALASVPLSVERPLETHHACATGTLHLLHAARQAGVRRVIYAGSSSAYGNPPHAVNQESDRTSPQSPYAAAKLAAEHYCTAFFHTYGLETVTLRYFNVFGPRQDPRSQYSAVIPLFITALLADTPPVIFGDGEQTRDFTFVENVVRGNLLAADAANVAGTMLNVADGHSTSLLMLLDELNRLLGKSIRPKFAPPRPGDVRHSLADITRARQLLGYEPPVSFADGLRRTVEYYRALDTAR